MRGGGGGGGGMEGGERVIGRGRGGVCVVTYLQHLGRGLQFCDLLLQFEASLRPEQKHVTEHK